MPIISVVVPVYKVPEYVRICLDSVLSQSFSDFEVILIDDGSPDECGIICDEYARMDTRVRVIHQNNQGLAGARNSGIEASKGSYITFVDSDDVLASNFLEILYDAAIKENADIAACICLNFEDGKMKCFPECRLSQDTKKLVYDGKKAVKELYDGNPLVLIGAPHKIYRRELLNDLRFPLGRFHEDQEFTPLALYSAKTIVFINAEAYYYRIRDNSITHSTFSLKRYDDIWAIDQCITFFKEKNEPEIVEAAQNKRKRILAVYSIYARRDGVEVPAQYRVGLLSALLYLRNHVQPLKFEYYLAQVSPKLARLFQYELKLRRMLGR